jgi:hypothetical protein
VTRSDEEAIMAIEEPEGVDETREREDEARQARADAEGERAAAEREAEGGGEEADSVLPPDTDEERRGVIRPPEGAGAE